MKREYEFPGDCPIRIDGKLVGMATGIKFTISDDKTTKKEKEEKKAERAYLRRI